SFVLDPESTGIELAIAETLAGAETMSEASGSCRESERQPTRRTNTHARRMGRRYHRLRAETLRCRLHVGEVAIPREIRARIDVAATVAERIRAVDVPADPTLAHGQAASIDALDRNREPHAQLRHELRRAREHRTRVEIVPLRRRLRREARVLDTDPVVVRSGRVPGRVALEDALHDLGIVDAVVGARLRRRVSRRELASEPACDGARLRRLLRRFHRVDNDEIDRPGVWTIRAREVLRFDERR